jgi:hypothetical protein
MVEPEELNPTMLKTIRLPNNLLYLTDRLPEANYDPIKTKLSAQFTKSTMPHMNDSTSKIGDDTKKDFL